jgi:hypothetical protein
MAASDKPRFHLPSPDDWKILVRDVGLDARQAHELDIVLRHVSDDLEAFHSRVLSTQDRFMAVERLKEVVNAFAKLEAVLETNKASLATILPSDALEALGQAMSHEAIEAALDIDLPTPGLNAILLQASARGDTDIRAAKIDQHFGYVRKSLGLRRGPELLRYLLKEVADPMRDWLTANSENDGGRPSNAVRDYLIIYLANSAETILGRMATATAGGPFSRLCSAVFVACGLSTNGIEDALGRALKKRTSSPRLQWKFDDPDA